MTFALINRYFQTTSKITQCRFLGQPKIATILAASVLAALPSLAAVTYTVTDLGSLPDYNSSTVSSINTHGDAVGSVSDGTHSRAVLFTGGTVVDLGTLGGASSSARSINDSGTIVGDSLDSGGKNRAFIFSNGVMTPLSLDNDIQSFGNAISNNGKIVGANGFAYLYSDGSLKNFSGLGGSSSGATSVNDSGIVVGSGKDGANLSKAFIYSGGPADQFGTYPVTKLNDLIPPSSGWNLTGAAAINAKGQVVGNGILNGKYTGFLFFNNSVVDLTSGASSSSYTEAHAINAKGQVVGVFGDGGDAYAAIFANGKAIDLNKLIPANSGWVLQSAVSINDAGQIVGNGTKPPYPYRAFLLTPTGTVDPTPAAPTAKLSGKAKVKTTKSSYTVKGAATGEVTSVTYRIGSRGAFKKAKGTNSWSFKAKLKPGKNKITIIVEGPGGSSKPLTITITRG